jgi:hypothetical protein
VKNEAALARAGLLRQRKNEMTTWQHEKRRDLEDKQATVRIPVNATSLTTDLKALGVVVADHVTIQSPFKVAS